MFQFLSTLSLRRATIDPNEISESLSISIHALLAESDAERQSLLDTVPTFLSTLSLRRATALHRRVIGPYGISIHALLAESDSLVLLERLLIWYFYPRSPCGERRGAWKMVRAWICTFLSTLSLRRATQPSSKTVRRFPYFYPRSPCGERRLFFMSFNLIFSISIHALLAESDVKLSVSCSVK